MRFHDKESAKQEFGFFRAVLYCIQWIGAAAFIAALYVIFERL